MENKHSYFHTVCVYAWWKKLYNKNKHTHTNAHVNFLKHLQNTQKNVPNHKNIPAYYEIGQFLPKEGGCGKKTVYNCQKSTKIYQTNSTLGNRPLECTLRKYKKYTTHFGIWERVVNTIIIVFTTLSECRAKNAP